MHKLVAAVVSLVLIGPGVAQDSWVTLKGRVVFDGPAPASRPINVSTDQGHCLEKGGLIDETWVVNASGGVKNVFLWLASDEKTGSGRALKVHPTLVNPATASVEVDQPRCAFVPRVLAIREGQALVVKNSSPVVHNVRWESGNAVRNKSGNDTIASGKQVIIPDLKQDRLPISIACSIHPWMKAWVRVFDSPYYAVTGDDGAFEIKLAPSGKCRLFVWHEGCGWKGGAAGRYGEEITLGPGPTQDLGNLKIKP